MKNQAYLAMFPRLVGIAKIAMIRMAQPTNPQSIHGRALPIRVLVRSSSVPKMRSENPSKMRETIKSVATTPASSPTVSVR